MVMTAVTVVMRLVGVGVLPLLLLSPVMTVVMEMVTWW